MKCINKSCMCYNEKETNNCDSGKDIIDCGNAELIRAEEKQMNEIEWKELDKNTRLDVFINHRYEIEHRLHDGSWVKFNGEKDITEILYTLKTHPTDNVFRFRLKPLESCRMTNTQWYEVCHNNLTTNEERQNGTWGGRKVEIIGDSE